MKKAFLFLFASLSLLACKRKENHILIQATCEGANGYECYIREGVKDKSGTVTINEEGNFTGTKEIDYTAYNEDYVFFTLYHENDTDITYAVKYYINDELVFDCEKDVKYKDNSNQWRATSCSYEEILDH